MIQHTVYEHKYDEISDELLKRMVAVCITELDNNEHWTQELARDDLIMLVDVLEPHVLKSMREENE